MNPLTRGSVVFVDIVCLISALRFLYYFFSTEPHNYWYLAGVAALVSLVIVPLLLSPKK